MPGSVKGIYLQFLTAYTCLYALCLVAAVVLGYIGVIDLPQPGVALVLALLPLLYYLVLFRLVISRLGRRNAYSIGVGLIFVPILFVSAMTGGYDSPNNIAFAFLVFLSAMLGPEIPLALTWAQIIGYLLGLTGAVPAIQSTPNGAVFVLVSASAAFTGWVFFRRYRIQEAPIVEQLRQTLHDEQLQSEAVIAAISDGVAIVNREGIAIHANQPFLAMLAISYQDLVGRHYKDVVNYNVRITSATADTPRIGPNITKVIETGEPVTIYNETVEYSDGRPSMDISLSITPLKNDDGEVGAVMIIARDITHIMHLQRMKDALITTASHELRTPITVIAGYADLLLGQNGGGLTDKQRHYLERTKETTAHLTKMVNDMLDISKLESGQRENNPERIDIMSFLQTITEEQLGRFASKQMSLHLDVKPCSVLVDESRLREVVDNLLNNAYMFAPESTEVIISARPEGEMVRISVQDAGPGVPEDKQATIFDKFTKLDTAGTQPGAGLGLAIAKTIVTAWGGEIRVKNISPHGADFSFTAPIVKSPPVGKPETKKENHS